MPLPQAPWGDCGNEFDDDRCMIIGSMGGLSIKIMDQFNIWIKAGFEMLVIIFVLGLMGVCITFTWFFSDCANCSIALTCCNGTGVESVFTCSFDHYEYFNCIRQKCSLNNALYLGILTPQDRTMFIAGKSILSYLKQTHGLLGSY